MEFIKNQVEFCRNFFNNSPKVNSIPPARPLRNRIILSYAGGGKTLFTRTLGKAVKQELPELTVFCINCEGSKQGEAHFEWVDILKSFDIVNRRCSEIIQWFNDCISEFDQITGQKLLIIDGWTLLLHLFKSDNFEFRRLQDKIMSYLCVGASAGINLWVLATGANELGISLAVRSHIESIVIIQSQQAANYHNSLTAAKLIPQSDLKAILKIAEKSPVNRAVYYSGIDKWIPMPNLMADEIL